MKLEDLYEQGARRVAKPRSITIYCDMDGVLADFHGHIEKVTGKEFNSMKRWEHFHAIDKELKKGNDVWGALEKLPDADRLMQYISQYDHVVLTSTGGDERAEPQKRAWLNKHYPGVPIIFAETGAKTNVHAGPDRLLIDDRNVAVDPWLESGGLAILHTSTDNTIRELNKLGL